MTSQASMRKHHFCTIITPDYLPFALNLHDSLERQGHSFALHVLVACHAEDVPEAFGRGLPPGVHIDFLDDVCSAGAGRSLEERYADGKMDALRWSLKPVYLATLLGRSGVDAVVYVDCDIHFFNDYRFIFDGLRGKKLLLTPHWLPYSSPAAGGLFDFDNHLLSGMFNAGFVAAAKGAEDALAWWGRACLFKCEFDKRGGYFVDQTYLHVMHTYFDGVDVLRHKGCNVAFWNQEECRREPGPDGVALIDGEYEVVFAHFPVSYMDLQVAGQDKAMLPYFLRYFDGLRRCGLNDYGAVFRKAANILRFKLEDVKASGASKFALAAAPGLMDGDCEAALASSGLDCVLRLELGARLDWGTVRQAGAQAILVLGRSELAGRLEKPGGWADAEVFLASVPRPPKNPLSNLKPKSELFPKALAKLAAQGVRRLALYGAGDFALDCLAALQPSHGIRILGVLDDDPAKAGCLLGGVPVMGADAIEELGVDAMLVVSDSVAGVLHANAVKRFPGIPVYSLLNL